MQFMNATIPSALCDIPLFAKISHLDNVHTFIMQFFRFDLSDISVPLGSVCKHRVTCSQSELSDRGVILEPMYPIEGLILEPMYVLNRGVNVRAYVCTQSRVNSIESNKKHP
jgi:hypothetical protein